MIKRIIFWDPCVSPHKLDLFTSLCNQQPDVEFIVCAQDDLQSDRREMGWSASTDVPYKLYIAPSNELIEKLAIENKAHTLHVISGFRHVPVIVKILQFARKYKLNFGIMSEPRVLEGFKGKVRLIQSWLTEGWIRKNAKFVLAIGRNGPRWFKIAGYKDNIIYPFAYFVNSLNNTEYLEKKCIEITYAGRFVSMKGIGILLEAIGKLPGCFEYHLNIAGKGEKEDWMCNYISNNKLNASMLGVVPMEKIPDLMASSDIVILPSISDDGWGVVVSEALLNGAQVIATNFVGASILLNNKILGECILLNNANEIKKSIINLSLPSRMSLDARVKRSDWANQHISGDAGAKYFMSILNYCFDGASRPNYFYE